MRVVHVADSVTVGGAEKQIVVFASLAQRHDIETTVVSLSLDDDDLSYAADLRDAGAEVVYLVGSRLLDFSRFLQLLRFLKQNDFDIVHTHMSYGNILGTLCGRLANLPVVSTLHSTGHTSLVQTYARTALETFALRYLTDSVIAVGYKVEQVHRARLSNKPILIQPNAVLPAKELPPQTRNRLRKELVGDPQKMLLISAGRIAPPKALHDMVTAVVQLHLLYPKIALILVGDGPLYDEIQTQIQEKRANEYIRLLGSRDDVPQLLAAADIYVSSSIWEGLPMAILEAMMAGLPVVATDVGDVSRVVLPQMGVIVPPARPELLASALESLIRDDELRERMGEAARLHAMSNYSAEIWIDKIYSIYSNVLNKKGVAPK